MKGYGQYCPLALAAELLCERWTLLVISRVIDGCTQFNAIHRGVPRITPAMLAKRLDEIEHAGLITRPKARRGAARTYQLTAAGAALAPLIEQMAVWGQHWARDMRLDDMDPAFLGWSVSVRIDTARLPPGRVVTQFQFSGVPFDVRNFWLVASDGEVDMCLKDPGFEVDLLVRSDLRRFIEAWRGMRDLRAEIRSGQIQVIGSRDLAKQFPDWLKLSQLAPHERKKPGREREAWHRTRAVPGEGFRGNSDFRVGPGAG
jgi:DNA-binding HxlR family transcriptional regulator